MKSASYTNTNAVLFHLHEVSKVVKFIATESRLGVTEEYSPQEAGPGASALARPLPSVQSGPQPTITPRLRSNFLGGLSTPRCNTGSTEPTAPYKAPWILVQWELFRKKTRIFQRIKRKVKDEESLKESAPKYYQYYLWVVGFQVIPIYFVVLSLL